VLGFDPRLQLVHEDDGIEVLTRAVVEDRPGTYNVGGDGVLLLSQAIRRAGRVTVPVPAPAVGFVGQALRRAGLADFSPEQLRFLEHGRVVDTARLVERFGYRPAYDTRAAFDDFVRARVAPLYTDEHLAAAERWLLGRLPAYPAGVSGG
jgi:UDP-glucose 4-epimerase